jgi:hypothetical protein
MVTTVPVFQSRMTCKPPNTEGVGGLSTCRSYYVCSFIGGMEAWFGRPVPGLTYLSTSNLLTESHLVVFFLYTLAYASTTIYIVRAGSVSGNVLFKQIHILQHHKKWSISNEPLHRTNRDRDLRWSPMLQLAFRLQRRPQGSYWACRPEVLVSYSTKPNPQPRRTDDNIKTSSSLDSLSRTQLRTDQLFKGLIRRRSKMESRYRQCWRWSKTQEEEA